MKMFISHIMMLSERIGQTPKQVQKGFERAGKGDGLDLTIVRGWDRSFCSASMERKHLLCIGKTISVFIKA